MGIQGVDDQLTRIRALAAEQESAIAQYGSVTTEEIPRPNKPKQL